MPEFRDKNILESIQYAAKRNGFHAYAFGPDMFRAYRGECWKTMEVVVAGASPKQIFPFYQSLTEKLVVSKEIKSVADYSIITNNRMLNFFFEEHFDPREDHRFDYVSLDKIYLDLSSWSLVDPEDSFNMEIASSIRELTNFDDIVHCVVRVANYNAKMMQKDSEALSKFAWQSVNSDVWQEALWRIIGQRNAGTALKILSESIPDGNKKISDSLVALAIDKNIPMNEGDSLVVNDKKLEIVNIYGDFYVNSPTLPVEELSKTTQTGSLRVLFNAPTLEIPTPFVERVTVMSAEEATDAKLLVLDDCLYPPCLCDPNACSPKCCCCSSQYIISHVRVRCHDRYIASCNSDGTAPAPDEAPFSGCAHCQEMCDIVSGRTPGITCANLPHQPWWGTFNSPTVCECKKWSLSTGDGDCLLYCVRVAGDKCSSNVRVTGGDCSFRISLTPSDDCCSSSGTSQQVKSVSREFSHTNESGGIYFSASVYMPEEIIFASNVTEITAKVIFNFGASVDRNIPSGATYSLDYPSSNLDMSLEYIDSVKWGPGVSVSTQWLMRISPKTGALGTYQTSVEFQASIGSDFFNGIVTLPVTITETEAFQASCQCLDESEIPVLKNSPECTGDDPPDHCYQFNIQKCHSGQNCQCDNISSVTVCGTTISISPTNTTLVCCSDVGFGCSCDSDPCPEKTCCGPLCPPVCEPPNRKMFATLSDAQNAVWCNCWTSAAYIETSGCIDCCCPNPEGTPGDSDYPCDLLDPSNPIHKTILDEGRCCKCPSSNADICCNTCRVALHDGNCGYYYKTRSEINAEVEQVWKSCSQIGTGETGTGQFPDNTCEDQIECLEDETIDAAGCVFPQNPDVHVLTNGVGLVAYESVSDTTSIKMKQFKTSAKYKAYLNQAFNYGRLEHPSKWEESAGFYLAKIYYRDDLNPERD